MGLSRRENSLFVVELLHRAMLSVLSGWDFSFYLKLCLTTDWRRASIAITSWVGRS